MTKRPRKPLRSPVIRYGARVIGPDQGCRYVPRHARPTLADLTREVWVFSRQDSPEVQGRIRSLVDAMCKQNGWTGRAGLEVYDLTPVQAHRPPKPNPSKGRRGKQGSGGTTTDWALWKARSIGLVPADVVPRVHFANLPGPIRTLVADFTWDGKPLGQIVIPPHCQTVADTDAWHAERQRRGGAVLEWTEMHELQHDSTEAA